MLLLIWFCVNLSVQLCLTEKLIVTLHEKSASFFVQSTFWEWHNQKTLDDTEYVSKTPFLGVPISLQSVHTNVSRGLCNVRVENFSQEVALRGSLWEIIPNH